MPTKRNPDLQVLVKDRNKTLFSGNAYSVSSVNDKGPFDILPQHANFISLIKDYLSIDQGLPTHKEIKVSRGVLTSSADKVVVYLGF